MEETHNGEGEKKQLEFHLDEADFPFLIDALQRHYEYLQSLPDEAKQWKDPEPEEEPKK